jgi:hypothetical protein
METTYTITIRVGDPPCSFKIDHGVNWQEALKGDAIPSIILDGAVEELKKHNHDLIFISILDIDRRSHTYTPYHP